MLLLEEVVWDPLQLPCPAVEDEGMDGGVYSDSVAVLSGGHPLPLHHSGLVDVAALLDHVELRESVAANLLVGDPVSEFRLR